MANILYIRLMLILIKDRTVPPILRAARYAELLAIPGGQILGNFYHVSKRGNFILNDDIHPEGMTALYNFMDGQNFQHQAFTILAVEEPEAHLHPVLQRLLYREILHKSTTSVIFTSHSTFIASVAPVLSIVLVSFGTLFLANPDLPKRFEINAALNEPDRATMFGGGAHGYIDYPVL